MKVSVVVAVAKNGAIGKGNQLIWKLPDDMKHFKEVTTGHAVIMGRKTFESIGRPLPNRKNIVITRQADYHPDGVMVAGSIEEALEKAKETPMGEPEEEAFVIGGAQIYKEVLPKTDRVYLTHIDQDFDGDAFFPELDMSEWRETSRREGIMDDKNTLPHVFLMYERIK